MNSTRSGYSALKRSVRFGLSAAIAAAAPTVWRAGRARRLVILMYHRILPADDADAQIEQPGMITRPESFAMHLRELSRYFQFVHLDDWIEQRASSSLPELACAVTFDDGWRDNYVHAWPVLREMRVPATIYLVSDLIGGEGTYWPTQLARTLTAVSPHTILERAAPRLRAIVQSRIAALGSTQSDSRREAIDDIIQDCKDLPDAWLQDAIASLDPTATRRRDVVSAAEIAEMGQADLVRFGSHTRRHSRLGRLTDPAVIEDEVVGSKRELEAITGRPVRTFCFPNGEQSALARASIERCYCAAVTTVSGWNSKEADPWTLRRIGMHDDVTNTPAALISRVSTLL